LIVSLTYYVLRDYLGDTVKWIGKFEKILMAAGIPVLIILLGMMNYTRDGKSFDLGLLSIVFDFVIKQGVTFSWVCGGMAAISALRSMCNISYTFGPFIDYITHCFLAQILFHASSIPNGNSLQKVFEGNCMDHSLSYLLKGEEMYLQGNGTGSSYLLELYSDFGIVGIIIFSFLLGMLLCLLFRFAKEGVIPAFAVLCTVSGIAGMPRSYAIGMIEFVWRPSFWLTILFALFIAQMSKWIAYRKKKISNI
jgi:oligosaccharide repeat unit polymerase